MKGIILAAGQGSRMRPFTNTSHKALLQVAGRTILQTAIDGLIENGVRDILIVLGYRAEDVQSYLNQTYPTTRFTYVLNQRYAETNNIVSLSLALDSIEIDQDIVLIECDIVFHASVIKSVIQSKYSDVALVGRYRTGMDGTVVVVDRGRILDIVTPQRQSIDFVFSDKFKTVNIYKFSKTFCNRYFKRLLSYYAATVENAYYELVLGIIIYLQDYPIYAEEIPPDLWMEIDTPNDLSLAKFIFEPESNLQVLEASFGGYWQYPILDFCFIRNMYFPSDAVLSELKSSFVNCIHNYGSTQTVLNLKLSYFLQCQPEHVVTLNGASQIFPILGRYFEGKSVAVPYPTFGEYAKWFPTATVYTDDGTGGLPPVETAIDMIVVVNPNNPTGTVYPTQMVYDQAAQHPQVQFVIDESFIDFSGQPSIVALLARRPLDNVIVIKSLSKNLGIPGLRLGYLYTQHTDFYRFSMSQLPIWGINSMAEFFCEIILRHRSVIQASYAQTILDRETFRFDLSQVPMIEAVYPSGGNFIMVKLVNHAPNDLEKRLLTDHKIYVRRLTKLTYGVFWRIAVRTPQENQYLVDALNGFEVLE